VVGEVVEDAAIDAVQSGLGGSCTVWRGHDAIMRLRRVDPGRSPGIACGRANSWMTTPGGTVITTLLSPLGS